MLDTDAPETRLAFAPTPMPAPETPWPLAKGAPLRRTIIAAMRRVETADDLRRLADAMKAAASATTNDARAEAHHLVLLCVHRGAKAAMDRVDGALFYGTVGTLLGAAQDIAERLELHVAEGGAA